MTEMAKEQRFIQMVLEEVFNGKVPGILNEDSEAAIYLSKNVHVSTRTKLIDVRQRYIRENLNNRHGKVVKVDMSRSYTDILTKNVSIKVFEEKGKSIMEGFNGNNDAFKILHIQREND